MKKNLLFIICALLTLTSFAQSQEGVIWEHGTFQEALNKAKANKKNAKLVFMDCFTTWCGPCKHMANVIFPQKEAGDYFNRNFVNIKIDMEKGEGIELRTKYDVSAFPTFLILDANGNEVGRIVGSDELNEFIKRVEFAKDIKNSPKYAKSLYDSDKTLDKALDYLKALEASYMKTQVGLFIVDNIRAFKVSEIFSTPMWDYFLKNLTGDNPVLLTYLVENKSTANAVIGVDKVNKIIVRGYHQFLTNYLEGRTELSKEEVREAANSIILLAGEGDISVKLCADVALLYSNGETARIASLCKFSNFVNCGDLELKMIERVFDSFRKEIREPLIQYYTDKADFCSNKVKECALRKDRL